jgi:uncharacterized protein (TIGR02996 family)
VHTDDDFLRKLLENPADDTVRLVYADWLDETGGEGSARKARFLRLTVRSPDGEAAADAELQSLAAKLPTDWLAVVGRSKVEGCEAKRAESFRDRPRHSLDLNVLFDFVCDRRWDEMIPTEDGDVRRCERCERDVHDCDTLAVARRHAEHGRCIAVDLGVVRRPNDLSSQTFWAGRPSAEEIWKAELEELDEVSRARELRKRQKAGETG